MTHGEDDGIDTARGLCEEGRQLGGQRGHEAPLAENAHHADEGERGPRHEPQAHVSDGHLGDADLGAFGVGIL